MRTSTTSYNRNTGSFHANFKYESYSYDGVYIGETKYEFEKNHKKIETYFNNYCIYSIDSIASVNTKINRLGQYLFYAEDMETGDVFYSYPNPASEETYTFRNNSGYLTGDMIFINYDSVLWFKHFAIDTVYSTHDLVTITPRYIFKTDKTFMNISDYTRLKNGVLSDSRVNKLNTISGILPLPATGDILFLINGITFIADKNGNITGCGTVINDIDEYFKDIDLTEYIDFRLFYIENNYLYILVGAESFFKEGCKPPFENLTEKSNPIVLKIKLKS